MAYMVDITLSIVGIEIVFVFIFISSNILSDIVLYINDSCKLVEAHWNKKENVLPRWKLIAILETSRLIFNPNWSKCLQEFIENSNIFLMESMYTYIIILYIMFTILKYSGSKKLKKTVKNGISGMLIYFCLRNFRKYFHQT